MQGVTVAVRYSTNIRRDMRRGYSYAEWALAPYVTRAECEAEWPANQVRYSRELGGWLPAHHGICAAACEWGETYDEALDAALANMRCVDGMEEAGVPLWAFEAVQIGTDPYGWPLVRPAGKPRRVS